MNDIDISFKNIICPKCGCNEQMARLKIRYGLYCKQCGKFIKWADHEQRIIIEAREAYLRQ